jgi:hypothetical protein
MASFRGVVFHTSMVDFLANLVDISFGSMLTDLATPAAGLVVIDNFAATDGNPPTHTSQSDRGVQSHRKHACGHHQDLQKHPVL